MKLDGSYVFKAPPQSVYALLLDPEALRTCVPGCEKLEPDGEDSYIATLKVGVAAIRGTYNGKIRISDKSEATGYTMHVEGSGGPGFVRGVAQIVLERDVDGTRVNVNADGQVGGTVAGVGQRMLSGVAKMLMNQFFECLRNRV